MTALRVGNGFDIHHLEAGYSFWLAGVKLEWPKGSKGYSDGDVALHALCDAMLGATGLGDIGEWFPPSDPQWKGVASHVFVTHVLNQCQQAGWLVENVDITILLEQPKLSPHKVMMRERVAQLLSVNINQVSIKAKTMEGLGDIGTGDAVAAIVTVLMTR